MPSGGNKDARSRNHGKMPKVTEDFPKNSTFFFDPNFDDMAETMSEMKLRIGDHLRGIKSRVKATENALQMLEQNQMSMRESMRQKAETSDRDIAKIVDNLGSLLKAIDMHTAGTMKMRSELERKLFGIQDMVITEISRFEDSWKNKYMKFTSHMADELEVICAILDQNRCRALPSSREVDGRRTSSQKSGRHRVRRDSRTDESNSKSPLTIPKHFVNIKNAKNSPSRLLKAVSDAIAGPASGDTRSLGFTPMNDVRSIVSKKLMSKLKNLNISPGVSRITDAEYRKKSLKLRMDLDQIKLDQSKWLRKFHRQLQPSFENRNHGKKQQENKTTFLPNFSSNSHRYFVRQVDCGSETEPLFGGSYNKKHALDSDHETFPNHLIELEKDTRYRKSDPLHSVDGIDSIFRSRLQPQPQIITPTTRNSETSVYLLKNVDMASVGSSGHSPSVKPKIRKEADSGIRAHMSNSSISSSDTYVSKFQKKKRLPVGEARRQQEAFESDQGGRSSSTRRYTPSEEGSNATSIGAGHKLPEDAEKSTTAASPYEIDKTDEFSSQEDSDDYIDQILKRTTPTERPKQRRMSQKELRFERKAFQTLGNRDNPDRVFQKPPMSLLEAVSAVKCSPPLPPRNKNKQEKTASKGDKHAVEISEVNDSGSERVEHTKR